MLNQSYSLLVSSIQTDALLSKCSTFTAGAPVRCQVEHREVNWLRRGRDRGASSVRVLCIGYSQQPTSLASPRVQMC